MHSVQTPLREIRPSLFIRLQSEAARRGQSAVKLAGGDVASLFARDAGWSTGHLLLVAARAEDERDVGFSSTYCVWPAKYRPSDGVVNFKMARHSLSPPPQNRPFQVPDNL